MISILLLSFMLGTAAADSDKENYCADGGVEFYPFNISLDELPTKARPYQGIGFIDLCQISGWEVLYYDHYSKDDAGKITIKTVENLKLYVNLSFSPNSGRYIGAVNIYNDYDYLTKAFATAAEK